MTDERPQYIENEDGFRETLRKTVRIFDIDRYVGLSDREIAERLVEFITIMKRCHDEMRKLEIVMGQLRVPAVGPLPRIERLLPPMSKIEALPATEDWCACGWSDEPHLRGEHEPAGTMTDNAPTPPHAACERFVSRPGEFAAGPDSLCDRCGASGRAHGIVQLGPPTQIAETLTPNED